MRKVWAIHICDSVRVQHSRKSIDALNWPNAELWTFHSIMFNATMTVAMENTKLRMECM